MWGGEIAAARLFCWFEFHQLDAGVIWIEDVELPFAVAAHLRVLFAVLFPSMRFEKCLRLLHVGDAIRNVIHNAGQADIWMRGLIQHVFEPIGAVWHLERNPIGDVVFHAAVPVGTESEDLTVEMIVGVAVVGEESDVDHAVGNRIGRGRGRITFGPFDELDFVAFGIGDEKAFAVVGATFDVAGLQPFGREIRTKSLDVFGGEGGMVHPISGAWIGSRAVSDPLLARHVAGRFAGFDRTCGRQAEDVGVKVLHAVGRRCIEGDVVDAGDARTLGVGLREGGYRKKNTEERQNDLLHGCRF